MTLSEQITTALRATTGAYVFSEDLCFGDLLWDVPTAEDVFKLEPALFIDAASGWRRVVIQRVAGEIRYWATEDRRPEADANHELGALPSVEAAAAFCDDFLGGSKRLHEVGVSRRR